MEADQLNHIRRNLTGLIRLTSCNVLLLSTLNQERILSEEEVAEIEAKPTDYEKSNLLYQYIRKKGLKAYQDFITALRKCEQDPPADILMKLDENKYGLQQNNTENCKQQQPHVEAVMKMSGEGVKVFLRAMQNILNRIGSKKLIFLAICGKMRTGKSFMLSLIIHYLNSGRSPNWVSEFLSNPNVFFKWRKGADPETEGVNIWSEPYFLKDVNGEDIAVVLMDCQGAFDQKTSSHQNSLIFAMAALLSSVFIYNVKDGIPEEAIQPFLVFMETAMRAGSQNGSSKVLQNLLILSRDVDEDDFKPGYYSNNSIPGGARRNLYKETFKPTDASIETAESRIHISSSFETVAIFAMPYPGSSLARRGDPSNLEAEFVSSATEFMEFLFPQENISKNCKIIQGQQMTGESCLLLFQELADKFNKNQLPQIPSLFANVAETQNNVVKAKALRQFNGNMENHLSKFKDGTSDAEMQKTCNAFVSDALKYFKGQFLFGGQDLKNSFEERLKSEMGESFKVFQQNNEHKRQAKISADKLKAEEKLKELALENEQKALREAEESKKEKERMKEAMIKQAEVSVQEAERQLEFAIHKKSLIKQENYMYPETTFTKKATQVLGVTTSPRYVPKTTKVLNQGQYDTAIATADADIKLAENRLKVAKEQLEIAKNT